MHCSICNLFVVGRSVAAAAVWNVFDVFGLSMVAKKSCGSLIDATGTRSYESYAYGMVDTAGQRELNVQYVVQKNSIQVGFKIDGGVAWAP